MLALNYRMTFYFLTLLTLATQTSCTKSVKSNANRAPEVVSASQDSEDFEDYAHYPEYEKLQKENDPLSFENPDPSAQSSSTIERIIASDSHKAPSPRIYPFTSEDWGKLEIEVTDFGHPSFAPLEVKVYVTCKERVQMIVSRPAPKRELVLKSLKACEFNPKDVKFDKKTGALTLRYLMQSPDARPSEPTCNEIWEQDFILPEICEKWSQRTYNF